MQGYEENIKAGDTHKLNHSTYIARTTFQLAGYYLKIQKKTKKKQLSSSKTAKQD